MKKWRWLMNKPNMWRLFKNASAIEDLLPNAVDEETGEIVDELLLNEINRLQQENVDTVEAMALYIKEMKMREDAMKREIESLKLRIYEGQKSTESVSKVLQSVLQNEKYVGNNFIVSFRKSSSVEVENEELLPDKYKNKKVTYTPDKKKIKEALKSGIIIDGAKIVDKVTMSVK